MTSDWSIVPISRRNGGGILGWNLESPTQGSDVTAISIRFRGWFLTRAGGGRITISNRGTALASVEANLPRPDVVRTKTVDTQAKQTLERCGFDLVVPRKAGVYRLDALEPGGDSFSFEIVDRNEGPYAVIGGNRHLFLGGDSNDSVGQFTEERRLSEASIQSWMKNFTNMRTWEAQYGLRCAFLVAPAKEEIFPDFYPRPRANHTVLDDFRTKFVDAGIVLPLWELRAQRNFAYSETDTHWTDQGATIAAEAVLKSWSMIEEVRAALPRDFRVLQRQGDLGIKVDPPRASYDLVFADDMNARLVFDNGVHNHGCLRVWRNIEAPVKASCMVFGDSFGTNLAMALTSVFAEVSYAYRPAAFDARMVEILKPSYVVLQITQRFLHGSPDLRASIFDTAMNKLHTLPVSKRADAIAALHTAARRGFAMLADPLIELLAARDA